MKKYLLYVLNLAIAVAMVSCSGHDDGIDDDGNGGGIPGTLTVTTGTPTEITETSAKIPVEVQGKNIIARGVCYSIESEPTVEGSKTNDGTTSGSITSSITGLTSGTTYYVRGYAINDLGIEYGKTRLFTTLIDGTNISFEDKTFEAYCLQLFDSNKDGRITIGEVDKIKSLDIAKMSISSIPEIQYFASLEGLDCYENQLTSLDVSGCTNLISLNCSSNQLTSLDVSDNRSLIELGCWDNRLSSLNVSGCTDLRYLSCSSNQLTSLDVSGCTSLTDLSCSSNQLTSLDVSNNMRLEYLGCGDNPNLQYLYLATGQYIPTIGKDPHTQIIYK